MLLLSLLTASSANAATDLSIRIGEGPLRPAEKSFAGALAARASFTAPNKKQRRALLLSWTDLMGPTAAAMKARTRAQAADLTWVLWFRLKSAGKRQATVDVAAWAVQSQDEPLISSVTLKRGRRRNARWRVVLRPLLEAMARVPVVPSSLPAKFDPYASTGPGGSADSPGGGPAFAPTSSGAAVEADLSQAAVRALEGRRREKLLHLAAGSFVRAGRFQYNQPVTNNLRNLWAGVGAGVEVAAQVYPLRFPSAAGTVRRFGLEGYYAQDFGVTARVANEPGARLRHQWSQWRLAAVARWEFPVVLVKAGVGLGSYASRFTNRQGFSGQGELPVLTYEHLNMAIGARLPCGPWALEGRLAYRLIRRGGAFTSVRFPNAAVGGVHARAALTLSAGELLSISSLTDMEIGLMLDYSHFYFDFRPVPGDTYVAGGALDLHLMGGLTLSHAL